MKRASKPRVPIEVVAYDAAWPAAFAEERDMLAEILAPWLVADIEHVGSTAVPGLCAKRVIDIMAPVLSLDGSRDAITAAERLGYLYYPHRPDQMHWFCKPSRAVRTHHLHLVPYGSQLWNERLAFRDALREDARLATEYGRLKIALAARHPTDREAYTDAKSPFIRRVLDGR